MTPGEIILAAGIVINLVVSGITLWKQHNSDKSKSADDYARKKIEEPKDLQTKLVDVFEREVGLKMARPLDHDATLEVIRKTIEFSDSVARRYSTNRHLFDRPGRARLVQALEKCKTARDHLAKMYIDTTMITGNAGPIVAITEAWSRFSPISMSFYSELTEVLSEEISKLDRHLSRNLTVSK